MRRIIQLIIPACLAATAWAGPVSNIVTGFSNTSNPNGVWSYEYYNTGTSTDVLYSYPSQSTTTFGQPAWNNNGSVPDSLYMIQNVSGSTQGSGTVVIPNGYLNLDPEAYNVEVIFTAPSTGNYSITGTYYGDDSSENSHPAEVLYNGSTVLFSTSVTTYQGSYPFNFSQTLNAGDTLAFLVGTGSTGCSYCDLSTGLQGTVTLNANAPGVPEPSTWMMVCGGAIALSIRRCRIRS